MIDMPTEKFTAEEAEAIGLVDAVRNGAVKVSGSYELKPDGVLDFKQKTFNFTDKFGTLHFGQFADGYELDNFALMVETNARHN